jgi:hypothetical protein
MTEPVDLSWAVQKAIYDVIAPAVAPIAVVDSLPDPENLPQAVVYFGDDPVQEIGSKDSSLERHDPSIHVLVQGSSKKPLRDLQAKIKAALDKKPISFTGAILSSPEFQSSGGAQVDVSMFLGTQSFTVFAQLAG